MSEAMTTSGARTREVVIANPSRRNALSAEVIKLLVEELVAAGHAADRGETGAVLLRGEGGVFSAGLDRSDPHLWRDPAQRAGLMAQLHRAIDDLPVPLVVALERYAIAGAAALVFAADFVVAGKDAYVLVPEIDMGMLAPFNVAWLASRHGPAAAREFVLGGWPVRADRLETLGIAMVVTEDDEVLTRARDLARTWSGRDPDVVRRIRRELRFAAADPRAYLERQLDG